MGKSSKKKEAHKRHKRKRQPQDNTTDSSSRNKKTHKVSNSPPKDRSDSSSSSSSSSSSKKNKTLLDEHPDNGSSLSLASRLKRERGTADSTPYPPAWSKRHETSKTFLTPDDDDDDDSSLFESCQQECYRGFSWEHPQDLPPSLHDDFNTALDALHDSQLFLYDAVQAGGKRVTHTFVTRTLVGKPGSTYRYLGLRLFSHPWSAVDEDGNGHEIKREPSTTAHRKKAIASLVHLGYTPPCAKALLQTGKVNQLLTERTQQRLQHEIAPHVTPKGLVGSAQYSLTLINRMEPSSVKHDLKHETKHGLGKTSVSWHKDSGLADFSSIAVYHTFRESAASHPTPTTTTTIPWRVGLRVASDNANAPPALSVPLPGGSLYYLLDDFNHKHEHAVIAGSNQVRYSSTHRVAREGRGTWQYIRDKCIDILGEGIKMKKKKEDDLSPTAPSSSTKRRKLLYLKQMRAQQQLLTEIEFEWLRQWGIQGKLHAELHPYWHKPIQKLMTWFEQLERSCVHMLRLLEQGKDTMILSDDLFDVIIEALEERRKLRKTWHERLKDPIYKSMPVHMQPLSLKVLDRQPPQSQEDTSPQHQLSENLEQVIANVRKWRVSFVNRRAATTNTNAADNNTEKIKQDKKRSNLTKKEKRKVASNWERMKLSMGKK